MGRDLTAVVNCEEVSRLIASDEAAQTGWRQRVAIRFHLLMCRHCRRYARQLEQIGRAARQILSDSSPDEDARNRLRDSILEQIPADPKDDFDS